MNAYHKWLLAQGKKPDPPRNEKWCECGDARSGIQVNGHPDGWLRCRTCDGLVFDKGSGDEDDD